jgi:hypothetical protein
MLGGAPEAYEVSSENWSLCDTSIRGWRWCEKHRVNHTFADLQLLLIERAVKAGKGQWDFPYFYEVLKQGAD